MDHNQDITFAMFDDLLGFANETPFLDVKGFILLLLLFVKFVHREYEFVFI